MQRNAQRIAQQNYKRNIRKMRQIRIKEFWDQQPSVIKNEIYSVIAEKCGVSYTTIQAWFLEYRIPGKLDKEAVTKFIAERFQVELIWQV